MTCIARFERFRLYSACIALQTYVDFTSGWIFAFSSLDADVLGTVIEEDEEARTIRDQLRSELIHRVEKISGAGRIGSMVRLAYILIQIEFNVQKCLAECAIDFIFGNSAT
jgi:hypothetical protein